MHVTLNLALNPYYKVMCMPLLAVVCFTSTWSRVNVTRAGRRQITAIGYMQRPDENRGLRGICQLETAAALSNRFKVIGSGDRASSLTHALEINEKSV